MTTVKAVADEEAGELVQSRKPETGGESEVGGARGQQARKCCLRDKTRLNEQE